MLKGSGMKRSAIALISAAFASSVCFAGNDSACATTTDGSPLREKASSSNFFDPTSLFQTLGASQLQGTKDGKKVTIWYDIMHTVSAETAGAYSRRDCGILIAVIDDGNKLRSTLMSLQRNEIDDLLKGVIPNSLIK